MPKKQTIKKPPSKREPSRKPNTSHKGGEPYSPNELHLKWYHQWAVEHTRISEIAAEFNISRQGVHDAVHKVSEWIRLETFDAIIEFRHRQTETLEQMVHDALKAWRDSIGPHEVTTTKEGSTAGENGGPYDETSVKSEELNGTAAYLGEARAAMADIRKIWGVDKPQKLEITGNGRGEGLERVAGMSRHEAIRRRATMLLERANKMEHAQKSAGQ